MAKVRVFFVNGIVDGVYVSDPEIDVEIVDYDRDRDDRDVLEELYYEAATSEEFLFATPTIIHPGTNEEE